MVEQNDTNAPINPEEILRTLGVTRAERVSPVTGGRDTLVWRVEHDGLVDALRLFRPEQAAVCHREAVVMTAAAASGLPVPIIRAEGTWHDRPAMLMAWCPGTTILAETAKKPWRVGQLGRIFGQTQATMHAIRAPDVLRNPKLGWIEWGGTEQQELQQAIRQTPHQTDRLIHLDYHPFNVLVDGDTISGVIDWTNARSGDPRADVARTITILRLEKAPPGLLGLMTNLIRRIFEQAWRRGYEERAGSLDANMTLFEAWAGAAMISDLAARQRRGDKTAAKQISVVAGWTRVRKRRAGIDSGSLG